MNVLKNYDPNTLAALLWLEKHKPEWFTLARLNSLDDEANIELRINLRNVQNAPGRAGRGIANLIASQNATTAGMKGFVALAKGIANGVKMFQPDYETCHALEQIELNVELDDYRQSYPAIFVVLPEKYRKELASRYSGAEIPQFINIYHDVDAGYIICGTNVITNAIYTFEVGSWKGHTLHELLMESTSADGDNSLQMRLSKGCTAVAANCALFLANHPFDETKQNAERSKRIRRQISSGKGDRELLEVELRSIPTVLTLKQNITVYDIEIERSATESTGTGPRKSPHWRKGHWRKQSVGPGWSQTKLVFIRPVLVNESHFVGDKASTEVTYRSPE